MPNQELKVTEIDALTGKVTERPLTAKEIADYDAANAEEARLGAEQQAKVKARQSALAKLAALGLTEAEIAAL
jgi:DNA-binding NarL/FixJ family response regulator